MTGVCRIGTVAIGTKLKLKEGFLEWEYVGLDKEGKILLRPFGELRLCISVYEDDIDWDSVTGK